MLVAAASDLALVIDERGVIRDVSFHNDDLARDLDVQASWPGRAWIDTVSIESRAEGRSAAARGDHQGGAGAGGT